MQSAIQRATLERLFPARSFDIDRHHGHYACRSRQPRCHPRPRARHGPDRALAWSSGMLCTFAATCFCLGLCLFLAILPILLVAGGTHWPPGPYNHEKGRQPPLASHHQGQEACGVCSICVADILLVQFVPRQPAGLATGSTQRIMFLCPTELVILAVLVHPSVVRPRRLRTTNVSPVVSSNTTVRRRFRAYSASGPGLPLPAPVLQSRRRRWPLLVLQH